MGLPDPGPGPFDGGVPPSEPTGLMPVTGRTSCWPSFGTSQRRRRDVPVSAAGVAYGADGRSKLTVGSTAADALSRGEAPGAAGSDGRALVERLVRGCGARLESRCAVSRACACARRSVLLPTPRADSPPCSWPARSVLTRLLDGAGAGPRRLSSQAQSAQSQPSACPSGLTLPSASDAFLLPPRSADGASDPRGATYAWRTGCSRMKGGDGRTGGGATITVIPSAGSLLASSSAAAAAAFSCAALRCCLSASAFATAFARFMAHWRAA